MQFYYRTKKLGVLPVPGLRDDMRTTISAVVGISVVVLVPLVGVATAPAGVVSNQMLAQGVTAREVDEHIQLDGWGVRLETHGESDVYFQDLVVGARGHSGWHSHPGLLLVTVKEGSVDWYGQDCAKRSFRSGQSFTEAATPHEVVNPGPTNAHLLIAYITKRGAPRRAEDAPPSCASTLGLPK